MNYIYYRLSFSLFRWKILCEDNFLCFLIFGSIRKNELKEKYLGYYKKYDLLWGSFCVNGSGPFYCA